MTSKDTEQSSDDFVVRVARVQVHFHKDDLTQWEEGPAPAWISAAKLLFDSRNHDAFGPVPTFIEWEDS